MPSTNGQAKTAILYARVSTREQAEHGYSLRQQMERLREYARAEGFEIVAEVEDPGQSGASLERPGMDRVRDLVGAGGVSVVLAQDRDRFSREPAYTYLLRRELEEHGCSLKSLNDRGDETPEGQLTDGILDQLAKYERAKIAERSRRGMLRKVREGYVNVTRPRYGFRYNEGKDGMVIREEEMAVVERIFRLAADGLGMHAIQSRLYAEGLPSATGKAVWDHQMIKRVIECDMYRPHTFEEIRGFVSPEVAARLDPEKSYGVQWYNRQKITVRHVSESDGDGGRRYRKRRAFTWRPKEEWIAIPVPAYLSRDLVDRARGAFEANKGRERKYLAREWELRGIMRCSCGKKMATRSTSDKRNRLYHYYVCTRRGAAKRAHGCTQGCIRAEKGEPVIWRFVSGLLRDPERIKAGMEQLIDQERAAARGAPEREAKVWAEKIAECTRLRSRYQEQQAAGYMTLEELGERLEELHTTRELAQTELAALDTRRERIEELEADRDTLLAHMAGMVPEALESLSGEERNKIYRMLRLEITPVPGEASYKVSGAFVLEERHPALRRTCEFALATL